MKRAVRGFGWLLLIMTAGCVAELGAPPGAEPSGESSPKREVARAAVAPSGGASERAPFSPRVVEHLAARGIKVHGEPTTPRERAAEAERERTTVVLPFINPISAMEPVQGVDPIFEPARYAAHIAIRWPFVVDEGTEGAYVDPTAKGDKGSCSGTMVSSDDVATGKAVLTSAHCVIGWRKVGVKASTGDAVFAKMRAYAHKVRPRRNGDESEMEKAPHGVSKAQHAYYKSANWPNVNPPPANPSYDYDYAVLSLRTPPTRGPIPLTKVRVAPTPGTQLFEAFHYPFAFQRGFRMFHSAGDMGALLAPYTRVYTNRISLEPGSSGGGVYELGAQGVVGLVTAEKDISPAKRKPDQKLDGYVNSTLLFTSSVVTDINFFILVSTE